jgi:hypothetical protein
MTNRNFNRSWLTTLWPALAIMTLLAIGWFVYRPALSGTFLLDDASNLGDLSTVTDFESAMNFALSGSGGPLGRPLALATFAAQASDWDSNPAAFLSVNILVHLLNGLLLYLFARQLARELRLARNDAEFLALATAACWLLMPLLASSTLMVVQRMATLSATFMLCGLNGYLFARRSLDASPNAALAGMSGTLVVATLLAVLTKENGALLPVFVLVMEMTLLAQPRQLPRLRWKAWLSAFLLAPTLLIVIFLLIQVSYSDNMVLRRGLSGWERLLTESRILWDYLINAFFARPERFGPFHDAYPVTRSLFEPTTLIAMVSWPLLVASAFAVRRKYPVAAFAVLWFVGGHLLESTTYPLELYFEHRNYVSIIGPVFALVHAAASIRGSYKKYARGAIYLYVLVNAGILLSVTSLWGNPLQAASYWHTQQPASVRAATTLAKRQMSEMGPEVVMITLQEFAYRHPEHVYIRIPELTIACIVTPDRDHTELLERLKSDVPAIVFSYTVVTMLDELLSVVARENCAGVGPSEVAALASTIASIPGYKGNKDYLQLHYMLMARISKLTGDTEGTLEYLDRAINYSPGDDLNMMAVTTLVAAHRFDDSRAFIESAQGRLPWQPLRRYNSRNKLDQLSEYVNEAERQMQIGDVPNSDDMTESP